MSSVFDSLVGMGSDSASLPSNEDAYMLPLEEMDLHALLELRGRIDSLLPARALKDLNLEEEAVVQFMTLKSLQEKVLAQDDTAANQKAQVANATASALQALDRIQRESYTFERFKEVENSLVEMLQEWPEDQIQRFMDEYERRLGKKRNA